MTAGSSLYVPVWNDGALIYTGDSHALQADGEVNITAIETAMEEVRAQVILHQQAGYAWPMIETPTHWLMLGLDTSLNEALRIALRNTIDFLSTKAGLSRDDAYGLASLAVDFRVSQMVDINNGIHAMIPNPSSHPTSAKASRSSKMNSAPLNSYKIRLRRIMHRGGGRAKPDTVKMNSAPPNSYKIRLRRIMHRGGGRAKPDTVKMNSAPPNSYKIRLRRIMHGVEVGQSPTRS